MTDAERERKLAANEAVARTVNEEVEQVASRWHTGDETVELVCECSLASCAERIHVPLDRYHAVRSSPFRFLVLAEHLIPGIEQEVGTAGDAVVAEKTGEGREIAEQTA